MTDYKKEEIAIIGLACRFPGAENYMEFWRNLKQGSNHISEITPERWDIKRHYSRDKNSLNKSYSKWGGLINDFDSFDNLFFNISPREASNIDPQQRLLLEETWHCLEDSGVPLSKLQNGGTAVFVGLFNMEYLQRASDPEILIESPTIINNYQCFAANRISYFFNFKGPSLALDTGCASSSTGVHLARELLSSGKADYALAAGASVICHHSKYVSLSKAYATSPSGQCKTFDAGADGYVPSEGVGVLLLQRLGDALAHGNHIYGIIKASAINHGGKAASVTAPNALAQKEVILEAFRDSGISPESVNYIEAHGTGTSLGDPIEIEALTQAFDGRKLKNGFCKIGSVKTNIGHSEPVSGIAGIIKVLMMMRHKKIPPSLNIKTLNPIINFSGSPFEPARRLEEWSPVDDKTPLRAGVSSFGLGGANSHIILESFGERSGNGAHVRRENAKHPFILSAKTPSALQNLTERWEEFVKSRDFERAGLKEVSATLTGRESFDHRCGFLVGDKEELKKSLQSGDCFDRNDFQTWKLETGKPKDLNFADLQNLKRQNSWLWKKLMDVAGDASKLEDREISGAIRSLWAWRAYISILKDFGFEPDFIETKGDGFLTGLAISGVLTPQDAADLTTGQKSPTQLKFRRPEIPFRDPANNRILRGFHFSAQYLEALSRGLNPSNDFAEHYLEKAKLLLRNQFTFKKYIQEWMEFLEPLGASGEENFFKVEPLSIVLVVIISSLTKLNERWRLTEDRKDGHDRFYELSDLVADQVMLKGDLVEFLTERGDAARIAESLNRRQHFLDREKPYKHLKKHSLELSEIPDLSEWVGENLERLNHAAEDSEGVRLCAENHESLEIFSRLLPSPSACDETEIKELLLYLWLRGAAIKWDKLYPEGSFQKLPMPTYPFEKNRFWLETIEPARSGRAPFIHPLIDANISNLKERAFEKGLNGTESYLEDHKIKGKKILPGVAHLEMVRAAAEASNEHAEAYALKDIVWSRPIDVSSNNRKLKVSILPKSDKLTWEISDKDKDGDVYSQGELEYIKTEENLSPSSLDIEEIEKRCLDSKNKTERYQRIDALGLSYGPSFQVLESLVYNEFEALGRVKSPDHLKEEFYQYYLPPGLMDGALQTVMSLVKDQDSLHIPFALKELKIFKPLKKEFYAYASFSEPQRRESQNFDVQIFDETGEVCASLKDFSLRPFKVSGRRQENVESLYFEPVWQPETIEKQTEFYSDQALLFDESGYLFKLLAEKYPQANPVLVQSGAIFQKKPYGYVLRLGEEEDYKSLVDALITKGSFPRSIVYLSSGLGVKDENNFYSLFYLVKALLSSKVKDEITILYIYQNKTKELCFDKAMGGLAKVVSLEESRLLIRTLGIDGLVDKEGVPAKIIRELNQLGKSGEARLQGNRRQVKVFREFKPGGVGLEQSPIKEKGVYIITGGLGGIGLIIAGYLAEKYRAKLVLTGRSKLSVEKENKLSELENFGAEAVYLQSDISDFQETARAVKEAKERFGRIHGVIHAAGATRQTLILKKTKEEIQSVLAPKIEGALNIDRALKEEKLDFMVFFSSIAGVLGDAGLADYAYANAFLDNFAAEREKMVLKSERHGKTVSVNWPYWDKGGMNLDESLIRWMEDNQGLKPLSSEQGLRFFEQILRLDKPQILVARARADKFRRRVGFLDSKENMKPDLGLDDHDKSELADKTKDWLRKIISDELKMQPELLKDRKSWENYGIDSVMIINLTRRMEQELGELSKTLFFEHQNIERLALHLSRRPSKKLIELTGAKKVASPQAVKVEDKLASSSGKPSDSGFVRFKSRASNTLAVGDIAVIGLSGRYPMAKDLSQFWRNLKEGRDCVTPIPSERWDWRKYYNPGKEKKGFLYSKWGGFLDDIDKFDPLFFNISPREAKKMDPQERLFLETVWHALEDSGYSKSSLSGSRTGVFAGVMWGDYQLLGSRALRPGQKHFSDSSHSSIANRASYFFNFRGPSLAVDTACSSSLTAVHLACQSIKSGECDQALAGGVNLSFDPYKYLLLSQDNFLSTDGRCRSFGKNGDGYVPGEGVGAAFLKPLEKAIEDGDQIYLVIKGSQINAGGKTPGYTVPNPLAQGDLIREALEKSGLKADSLSYIEAHGTGTSLGDPIEINGLKRAFEKDRAETQYCAIGSVKSNIGHLESASGIAGLTKVALQMKHGQLVPSIHSKDLNPNIDFKNSPFYVQRELSEWRRRRDGDGRFYPLRAGISSFGAGGANAHIIVEEYKAEPVSVSDSASLVVVSAKKEESLKASANNLLRFLEKDANKDPADLELKSFVEREVLKGLSELIQIPLSEIDKQASFQVQGVDPLQLEDLRHLIERSFNLTLDFSIFAEHTSIEALSAFLKNNFAEELSLRAEALKSDDTSENSGIGLADLAYTLQVGREPMDERLALKVDNKEELMSKLGEYLKGVREAPGLYSGNVKKDGPGNIDLLGGKEGIDFLETIIKEKKLDKLARLWTSGMEIDWNRLYEEARPRKVSLPLYPFVGKRYWIASQTEQNANQKPMKAMKAKPNQTNKVALKAAPTLDLKKSSFEKAAKFSDRTETLENQINEPRSEKSLPEPINERSMKLDQANMALISDIKAMVKKELSEISSMDVFEIEDDRPFAEMGMDSVMGVELANRLKGLLGVELPTTKIYDYPSVSALSEHLAEAKDAGNPNNMNSSLSGKSDGTGVSKSLAFQQAKDFLQNTDALESCQSILDMETLPAEKSLELEKIPQKVSQSDSILIFDLKAMVKKELSEISSMDVFEIEDDRPFAEMGMDSVMAVELANRLKTLLGVDIPATKIYDYPSVDALSEHLFEAMSDESSKPAPIQIAPQTSSQGDGGEKERVFLKKTALKSKNFKMIREESQINPKPARIFPDLKSEPASIKEERPVAKAASRDIAIIGLSARFPDAEDYEEFWKNLADGRDSVREIPPERWDWRETYDPNHKARDKSYCKHGGFLDDVDKFDPMFFNISPAEAELMDPQQRLFLEESWKALEDAGYSSSSLSGMKCGVYAGIMNNDYERILASKSLSLSPSFEMMGNFNSILAARIAYFLNLKGATLAVDTACSSSLMAIHLACQSLLKGETDMALAGGVTLYLSPYSYVMMCKAGMLSPEGKCKSFDENADGFVPGEGVGVIALKRFDKALEDGDVIYGLIKGSGVNQDGKTNGITAPSANSQRDLELEIYRKSGVNPETITYVETHGTGTKLGDPIEIEALSGSFGEFTEKKQYCAVGSVKSNIGHASAAAGIAGVIKVLMAMKYGKIPPSINFKNPNSHIDFQSSPFYVNSELSPWGAKEAHPRRAAVSAFGFSGSNAHVVLEEYLDKSPPARFNPPYLVVLSAANKERLNAWVRNLKRFLEKSGEKVSLENLAYTLQVGREAMEERLSFAAHTKKELLSKLEEYLENGEEASGVYLGNAKRKNPGAEFLISGNPGRQFIKAVIKDKELDNLAQLWSVGARIDWNLIYGERKPRRVPLPTYPFAKESYWITEKDADEFSKKTHYLLGELSPELSLEKGIVFKNTISPDDLIVRDHQALGRQLFPGVGMLEAAYAALGHAFDKDGFDLFKASFIRPLWVTKETEVLISLEKEADKVKYSFRGGSQDKSLVYSVGEFRPRKKSETRERFSVEELKAGFEKNKNKEQFYSDLNKTGIRRGPSFKTVKKVWFRKGEALALLEVDKNSRDSRRKYLLIPGMLDGALQISAVSSADADSLKAPFSLEKMEVFSAMQSPAWAYLKETENNKYNLAVFSSEGEFILRIHGFFARELKGELEQQEEKRNFYYSPRWKSIDKEPELNLPALGDSVLIIHNSESAALAESLAELHGAGATVKVEASNSMGDKLKKFERLDLVYFLACAKSDETAGNEWSGFKEGGKEDIKNLFRLMKTLAERGFLKKELKLKIAVSNTFSVAGEEIIPRAGGVLGFARSLAKEYPNLSVGCLDLSASDLSNNYPAARRSLAEALTRQPFYKNVPETLWRNNRPYRLSMTPASLPKIEGSIFKEKGVYLILGGAGGIGLELARYLAETKKAGLILIGRSGLSKDKEKKLNRIRSLGSNAIYLQADAADFESLEKAVEEGRKSVGEIKGVIHSALVLEDRIFARMTESDLEKSLAPKVDGSCNLAAIFKEENLDFMIFFSSMQSFWGNIGQSNYAAASGFLDSFSRYLDQNLSFPVKVVNWGFWGTVGVVADESHRTIMNSQGIYSIAPSEGMEALETILNSENPQTAVVKAEPEILESLGFDLGESQKLLAPKPVSLIEQMAEDANLSAYGSLENFEDEFSEIETLAPILLLEAFQRQGIFKVSGEKLKAGKLRETLGVIAKYRPLYGAMLDALDRAGFIRVKGEEITVLTEALSKKEDPKNSPPALSAHFKLLSNCLDSCFEMLRGEVNHTNVLFPKGSLELVEKIYSGNLVADSYNALSADLIGDYIEKRLTEDPDKKLRILEVGAGTGGSSRGVLKKIKRFQEKITYYYTDISPRFTKYAREEFQADYPFVKFMEFDVEKDPEKQGFETGSFDLAFAVNVIHATANISGSLNKIKQILKPGGVLLLSEASARSDFLTMTFGFADGWWLFEDAENRIDNSPLLNAEQWLTLLKENGFLTPRALGLNEGGKSSLEQRIILGESDGLIWDSPPKKQTSQVLERQPAQSKKTARGRPNKNLTKDINSELSEAELREQGISYLKSVFSKVLKIEKSKIQPQETFENYGVDSLMVLELTKELENDFGDLNATLLFENITLERLSDYFIANHKSDLKRLISMPENPNMKGVFKETVLEDTETRAAIKNDENKLSNKTIRPEYPKTEISSEGIAVIGMSGRYPGA